MFDSKGSSVEPRFGVNVPPSDAHRAKPARSFRFGVTWTSLTTGLQLRPAAELTSAAAGTYPKATQSSLAVLAAAARQPLNLGAQTRSDSSPRWEMVVPKMVRPERVSPDLIKAAPPVQHRNHEIYTAIPVSTPASLRKPLPESLASVLAAIGRRTKSLLAGPGKTIDAAPVWSHFDRQRLAFAARTSRLQVLQLSAPSSPLPVETRNAENEDRENRHAVRELLLSKITSRLRVSEKPGSPYSYDP